MIPLIMRLGYLALLAAPLAAQPRTYTAADYAHAEQFMPYNTTSLVFRSGIRPNWLASGRFWYRVHAGRGRVRARRSRQRRADSGVRSRQTRRRALEGRERQLRFRAPPLQRNRPHRRHSLRLLQRERPPLALRHRRLRLRG